MNRTMTPDERADWERCEAFAAPGGWRFRLNTGYGSHTVFGNRHEAEEAMFKAFWRHRNFPTDYVVV